MDCTISVRYICVPRDKQQIAEHTADTKPFQCLSLRHASEGLSIAAPNVQYMLLLCSHKTFRNFPNISSTSIESGRAVFDCSKGQPRIFLVTNYMHFNYSCQCTIYCELYWVEEDKLGTATKWQYLPSSASLQLYLW